MVQNSVVICIQCSFAVPRGWSLFCNEWPMFDTASATGSRWSGAVVDRWGRTRSHL